MDPVKLKSLRSRLDRAGQVIEARSILEAIKIARPYITDSSHVKHLEEMETELKDWISRNTN